MTNALRIRWVILLLSIAQERLSGTEFTQFDYTHVYHVEGGLSGFELAPKVSSSLDCAVTCAARGHLSFSYEEQTNNCRTCEEIIDENYDLNISSTVTYFTREVCSTFPFYNLATASNTSGMVIVSPNGTTLYPVGTQVQFTCGDNLYFLGGTVTCTSSGDWTAESTPTGCSAKLSGGCLSDSDCVTVSSAICTNGLCGCANVSSFNPEHEACITDCLSLYEAGMLADGVYEIKPDGSSPVDVYCDMSNGGWTVFQNRVIGDVEFATANWSEMVAGLGSPLGDHWLGLPYIHMLTWMENLVYFDLVLLDDTQVYFQYSNFTVGNYSTMFVMSVAQVYLSNSYSYVDYSGFYAHDLMKFTTTDSDNDLYVYNCANVYGPWWYNACGVFGAFNDHFNDMNFWNVPSVGRVYVKQSQIKIRRL